MCCLKTEGPLAPGTCPMGVRSYAPPRPEPSLPRVSDRSGWIGKCSANPEGSPSKGRLLWQLMSFEQFAEKAPAAWLV